MSFLGGASKQQKANDAQIQTNTAAQTSFGDTSKDRAGAAFKIFNKSVPQAMDFWKGILEGDSGEIAKILQPEVSNINNVYANQQQALNEFSPRGGAQASGNTEIANQKAHDIGTLYNQIRPMAADRLTQIGALASGVSGQQGGLGLSAYNSANQNLFGINQEEERRREAQAQFWGGIGGAAGNILGAYLGKPPG